jgi:hypothetical protein
MGISYLWRNCSVLLVPLLVFNVALMSQLPAAFQRDVFWADIPMVISVPENTLRLLVMLLPALMPLSLSSRTQRVGLGVFCVGAFLYFASWVALILAPDSGWSRSAPGFLAPAYTPLLWLAGLTMLGDRLVLSRFPYRHWMYGSVAALFVAFHVSHAFLVWWRAACP